MSDERQDAPAGTEVPHQEWRAWCRSASESMGGHEIILTYADVALGEVRLAEGQPFVSIEHVEIGSVETLTIKYGAGVVPVRHVIAEPREILQQQGDAGQVEQMTIVDATSRRTFVRLA